MQNARKGKKQRKARRPSTNGGGTQGGREEGVQWREEDNGEEDVDRHPGGGTKPL